MTTATATATASAAGARAGRAKIKTVVGTRRQLDAAELAATGLRDRWYPIYPSRFVGPGDMVKVRRLGVDWLLFRDARGGQIRMLEDRCPPHRSAPRYPWANTWGDRVACKYHGVQVDGRGTVVSVPGDARLRA